MKRLLFISLMLAVLGVISFTAWRVAGLPPVGFVLRHGLSYGCEPTGETRTIEGVEFVEIGPGCFRMGSGELARGRDLLGKVCAVVGLPWGDQPGPSDEMPVHWVEFAHGYWIAKYEVTNAQYERFAKDHGREDYSSGDDHPVVDVSWEEARKYCAWLAERSGLPVRLPSESEWESACRAGSETEYCFGDNVEQLDAYAWFGDDLYDDRLSVTHPVGRKRRNVWGIFDLHGNVRELCEDAYHDSYEGAPAEGSARMEGGMVEWGRPLRVIRGGGRYDLAEFCRSAARWGHIDRDDSIGFRPAFSLLND